jgi:hypothetical protein
VVNTVYNSLTKIDTTGLVFCSDNDYKGYSTFSPEGSLDQTKIVTLAPKDITALEDYRPTFRANQLKYYGISEANKDYNFEVTVSAFVISSFKVIVLWSDGLCYCEVGCFNYVNNNNVITLTSGPGTVPPTVAVPAGLKPNKGARTSVSKDSVGLRYMDFNVCMINNFDAYIGALIGFLWYNAYPAQVFMGDTGSLTIGGIIAVYAIIIHKELLIPILCGIFLVENLSVILQRVYYKAGKRKGVKQRLFKRTPIHDHFRTGMNLIEPGCKVVFTQPAQLFHESKITVRFWIVTIVLAAITIITLKIR